MSIIAAGGPINWSNVVLPPGRSQMACWHVVDHAKKDAAKSNGTVNKDDGDGEAAPAKKKGGRPKKAITEGGATTPNKSKRGRKTAEKGVERDGNGDEETGSDDGVVLKKAKLGDESEDNEEEKENGVKEEDSDEI